MGPDLSQPSAEFFHNMDYFKFHNMRPPFTYATLIRWVSRACQLGVGVLASYTATSLCTKSGTLH